MANIEIDGVNLEAEPGSMIIEVADKAGISIPRFCYHKKLSVAANCRMCLVDVENLPKPVPACATPISDGMTIKTHSKRALDAQKSVMEFLLINHPLDCPICDQGGECELQDIAVGYGGDVSRFTEGKRVVKSKNIGPLIATDMTRCIHCTRCVRFGQEVAGIREMGATGRGEHTEIGTYIEKTVDSEVSGNIIDLCPVGALTAKPSRYQARAWEMQQHSSIAPHDCWGSNVHVHTRRNEVIRVVPDDNESINETWISDRDRFSYQSLNAGERLTTPMVKENGEWKTVDWQTALNVAVDGLNKIKNAHGADAIAAVASPSATTEELYLAQKLMRDFGSSNIETRLRRMDFSNCSDDALYPSLGMSISELENLDATLIVGSNLRKELPLAAIRLRKATRDGQVMMINAEAYPTNFKVKQSLIVEPSKTLEALAGVAKALAGMVDNAPAEVSALNVDVSETHSAMAKALLEGEKSAIILGADAYNSEDYSKLAALGLAIATMSGASFGTFSDGANSAGAHLVGALPHRGVAGNSVKPGLNMASMKEAKAFLLHEVEPAKDASSSFADAVKAADLVVAMTAFADSEAKDYADVLLPIGAFTETSGTYVNVEGTWQSFAASVSAKGEARPAWKVYRVLGNLLELSGFEYTSSEEVLAEVKGVIGDLEHKAGTWAMPSDLNGSSNPANTRTIYDVDALVRRSSALQDTLDAKDESELQEGAA